MKAGFIYILFVFTLCCGNLSAQNVVIKGRVTDAKNSEPLPYVNISLKGTNHGTITDANGKFTLNTSGRADTLVVNYLGYQEEKIALNDKKVQEYDIKLKVVGIQLGEVVVMPGKDPEDILLKLIQERRKINKPKNLDYYSYDVYNKLEFDLNNISEEFGSSKWTKSFEFLKTYIDTADVSKKKYLPFFISETFSSIYYRNKPKRELEFIKANKISGIDNQSLKRYTGDMYQDVDIYENVVNVLDRGFISPLGAMGEAYYEYKLTDTSWHDNRWCYRLEFEPKRKHEPTMEGYVWINDTTYAIKSFEISLSKTANINFVDSLVAEKHFVQIEDSIWLLKKDRIFVDFNILDKQEGFFGRKTSYYSNHKINEKVDKSIFKKKHPSNLIYLDSAKNENKKVFDGKRPEKLSKREQEIYNMVDTIKNVKAFKRWETILTTLVSGYYTTGPVEIGPIYSYISSNPVEGTRLRFGLRTSNDFSKKIMLDGYGAYGFKDKEWKYGGGITYMLDVLPRRLLHFDFAKDYLQSGDKINALSTDNVLATLLRRPGDLHMYQAYDWNISYEHEFVEGISGIVGMQTKKVLSRKNSTFKVLSNKENGNLNYRNKKEIQSTEIKLGMHLAPGEKFMRGQFERISLGTKNPVININIGFALKDYFGNNYEYLRSSMNYRHKLRLYPLGELHYAIEAGKLFGKAPFSYLFTHRGNQSFAYYDYAFNLMNFHEFISDEYVSLFTEHRFEGFFLNHIPLLRKLKWREHIGFKATYGRISDKNREFMAFPSFIHDFSRAEGKKPLPYIEVNAGISNIFKVLRLDAVWRLSHLDNDDIYPFAIMAKLQLDF